MENLTFADRLDHASALFDDVASVAREDAPRRAKSNPPPAYQAASLLDGLSACAAVFDCSAGCQ